MWQNYKSDASKAGIDINLVVTMASIVEKETAVPEERPRVASVYYNRLAQRMALDADPSVIYAELLQGTYGGSLHHADRSSRGLQAPILEAFHLEVEATPKSGVAAKQMIAGHSPGGERQFV